MNIQRSLLGMFGSIFGILLSWSSFILGEATLRGYRIYGVQARLASVAMFSLCMYGFWQLYGKFLLKENKRKLTIIISELVAGTALITYLNITNEYFEKDFQLALIVSVAMVLTDNLWKEDTK